jgi:DNA-binding transcriptional LysR family regulator
MQLKWLEDFVALADTRSFSRAAELRHVTHPAFGRRIKALEDWAGTPLLERGCSPVQLTAAGHSLLEHAQQTTHTLAHARDTLQREAGRQQCTVTVATGRTLARTLVADWLRQLQPLLESGQGEMVVRTRSLSETQLMLEQAEADFMLTYHHPLLAVRLNARQYSHRTLAQDKLVPLARCDARASPPTAGTRPNPVPRCPGWPTPATWPWGDCWVTTWPITLRHRLCAAWWTATRPMPCWSTPSKAWVSPGCLGHWPVLPAARANCACWAAKPWWLTSKCACTAPNAP